MRRLLICVAAGLALCAGSSPAQHEGKGKPKECKESGRITSIGPDGHHFTVKDAAGQTHHVCCDKECKITAGDKAVTCKDIKVGMKVRLSGHEACHCAAVRVLPKGG